MLDVFCVKGGNEGVQYGSFCFVPLIVYFIQHHMYVYVAQANEGVQVGSFYFVPLIVYFIKR